MKQSSKFQLLLLLGLSLFLFNNNEINIDWKFPFPIPNIVDTNPLPSSELRVLIVKESEDANLSKEVVSAMDSVNIDQAVKENAGILKRWDKDINTEYETDKWYIDALTRTKTNNSKLPFYLMSKGSKFREGPITTLDSLLSDIQAVK